MSPPTSLNPQIKCEVVAAADLYWMKKVIGITQAKLAVSAIPFVAPAVSDRRRELAKAERTYAETPAVYWI